MSVKLPTETTRPILKCRGDVAGQFVTVKDSHEPVRLVKNNTVFLTQEEYGCDMLCVPNGQRRACFDVYEPLKPCKIPGTAYMLPFGSFTPGYNV